MSTHLLGRGARLCGNELFQVADRVVWAALDPHCTLAGRAPADYAPLRPRRSLAITSIIGMMLTVNLTDTAH